MIRQELALALLPLVQGKGAVRRVLFGGLEQCEIRFCDDSLWPPVVFSDSRWRWTAEEIALVIDILKPTGQAGLPHEQRPPLGPPPAWARHQQ